MRRQPNPRHGRCAAGLQYGCELFEKGCLKEQLLRRILLVMFSAIYTPQRVWE
jgi:hypothetical protein